MFVLEALLLTFMTTPVVTILYPPHLRVRVTTTGANFSNIDGEDARNRVRTQSPRASGSASGYSGDMKWRSRFTIVLDKVEHLPAMMSLTHLIHPSPPPPHPYSYSSLSSLKLPDRQDVSIDALRLIELSDRVSAVMKGSATDTLVRSDPTLEIYRTFGDISGVDVTTSLAIVSFDDLAPTVVDHARNHISHLVLLPWLPPTQDLDPPTDQTPGSQPTTPEHHNATRLIRCSILPMTGPLQPRPFTPNSCEKCSRDAPTSMSHCTLILWLDPLEMPSGNLQAIISSSRSLVVPTIAWLSNGPCNCARVYGLRYGHKGSEGRYRGRGSGAS